MSIASSTRLKPNHDEITASVVDGEAIVVNLGTGVYYSLDHTGAEAWGLIEKSATLGGIASAFAERYGIPVEQAQADVEVLAAELLKEQLVVEETEGEAPACPALAAGAGGAYVPPSVNVFRDMVDLLALDPPMPGLRDIPWQGSKETK